VISHDHASELLGAYALDAVDGDELSQLEGHLATCPRCQSELDSLREVAAALGNSTERPPDRLWASIAEQLDPDPSEHVEPPPMPRLVSSSPAPFRAPAPGRTRRTRSAVLVLAVVAVAASAVAVVLGIDLVHSQNNVTNLQQAATHRTVTPPSSPAEVALHTPGHRIVTLENAAHDALAEFVVVPAGRGYLVSSNLPNLGSGKTYQLWGIVGSTPISLGLLGASPHASTFTMTGATGANGASELALSAEPNGGTVMPTGGIVASGPF
jgi:anti-sigma factor RsiW